MTFDFTNRAIKSFNKIIDDALQSGVKQSHLELLVEDFETCFQKIESDYTVGVITYQTSHEQIRLLGLEKFDSYVIIYRKINDEVLILDVLLSWMTGI